MRENIILDNKAVGRRIREERKKLGLSQEELAELVELSNYYIGQLERGERQMSLPVLVSLANCLHLSLDYLIFGEDIYNSYLVSDIYSSQDLHSDFTASKKQELESLLQKCSPKELDLIRKIIKTILPYLPKN